MEFAAEKNKDYTNSLETWQPLSDLLTYFAFADISKMDEHAVSYLRFGVAKRISLILRDIRWLTSNCPAHRVEALRDDECELAGLHLNSFYLNIRGTLDNFAWALYWLIAPIEAANTEASQFMQIGLFQKPVLNLLPGDSDLRKVIDRHRDWSIDLRSRRDPAAHRLPLRVIPQIISEAENSSIYIQLNKRYVDNVNELAIEFEQCAKEFTDTSIAGISKRCEQIEKIKEAHDKKQTELSFEMQSQGRFVPVFTYSAGRQELIPLYPTITDDTNSLIKLSSACKNYISSIPT